MEFNDTSFLTGTFLNGNIRTDRFSENLNPLFVELVFPSVNKPICAHISNFANFLFPTHTHTKRHSHTHPKKTLHLQSVTENGNFWRIFRLARKCMHKRKHTEERKKTEQCNNSHAYTNEGKQVEFGWRAVVSQKVHRFAK